MGFFSKNKTKEIKYTYLKAYYIINGNLYRFCLGAHIQEEDLNGSLSSIELFQKYGNDGLFVNKYDIKNIGSISYKDAEKINRDGMYSEYSEREHYNSFYDLPFDTGLVDPKVEIRPIKGQIDDLMGEIRARAERNERVLVTTLTKKMAEDICEYLEMNLIKVRYIHHNVETMERQELIRDLRLGVFDVLIGVNLLREGLDIPEVSLVAILDADKEGFLRSKTSLVQTVGRAARNADGTVIMYADSVTESMAYAIGETERRRKIQTEYNEKHGIIPQTVKKEVRAIIEIASRDDTAKNEKKAKKMTKAEKESMIETLTKEMKAAAAALDFEHAAHLRDMTTATPM